MPTACGASDPPDTPGKLGKLGSTSWPTLTVQPAGWQALVAPDQTLLQAARAAGLNLPSSCRNGSCRACLCQLVSGTIHYQIDWPGLLAEEKAAGWILPCVAGARSNVVIASPAASRLPGG
ncbi:MAG: 2Fe-2S iron-sulfur cluster binding domain-containing protein [Microbacteriaceae bacterium]|nr:2Fe-2S iron-sulfur cluster binding domain-containing protein [Burkholderiaceae bacterium]